MKAMYRRMQILSMIPRSGTITTQQIEERLAARGVENVLRRTIQRDLEAMLGFFPLTYEQDGQTYFWSWSEGARILEMPTVEPHAALTFCLMNDRMPPMLPSSSHRYLDPYFSMAKATLDGQRELPVSRWREKVASVSRSLTMENPVILEEVRETVYEAVLQERRLAVSYRPRGEGELKEYAWLNPLGLVFVESLIYLVATVKEHGNTLQFLLHRMESATMLKEQAAIPEGFSLQGYLESGEFSYPMGGSSIKLKAVFEPDSAAYLRDTPLHGTVKVEEVDDGRALLEAEVRDSRQLRWWLNGFGEAVEVLEPAGLREEFRQTSRRLRKMYG